MFRLLLAATFVGLWLPHYALALAGDLGEFAFPLSYAVDEEEGKGLLCPSIVPPKERVLLLARQSFAGRVLPESNSTTLRLYVPAFRNLGEQRRLASRIAVKLDGAPLEHKTTLIYTRPWRNPFFRIECTAGMGNLEVQVDSWLAHVAAPENPTRVQLQLVSKQETAAKIIATFDNKYGIAPLKHWWTDPTEKLSPKPLTLGVSRKATLATAADVLAESVKRVPFNLERNSLVPGEALAGGDSGSRASLCWYVLQDVLPTTLVGGYARELVDNTGRGWHAWNLFVYGGGLVGDVRGGSPYLGPDHANYLATSIGGEDVLDELPMLPRYATHNSGFWYVERGRMASDKTVVLSATSALGRITPVGKVKPSIAVGEAGCGPQQNELNRQLADPPPGVLELAQQVERERKRLHLGR